MTTVKPVSRAAARLRALTGFAACVAVLSAVSGCEANSEEPGPARDVVVHEDGEGPLSASSAEGGKGLLAPGKTPWSATFGGLLLCMTESDAEAVIKGVRYTTDPAPRRIRPWLRVVPPPSEQSAGKPIEWAPFYGLVGSPGAFSRGAVRGDFVDPPGERISQSCADSGPAFTELVTEMQVPAAGAWVRSTSIDYTVEGKAYTLDVAWQMVGCGDSTSQGC